MDNETTMDDETLELELEELAYGEVDSAVAYLCAAARRFCLVFESNQDPDSGLLTPDALSDLVIEAADRLAEAKQRFYDQLNQANRQAPDD